MDSLLASYASSDDEEEESEHPQNHQIQPEVTQPKESIPKANFSSSSSSLFSALPPPKSASSSSAFSSLFSSLPQPKSSSSLSSSLSPPTSTNNLNPQILPERDPEPKINPPKKVVQFMPPVNPYLMNSKNVDDDDDDEDEDDKELQNKKSSSSGQSTSVKSFLSSMLPAPKNSGSLGSLPSASSMGRRSILEADAPPASSTSTTLMTESKASATTLAENQGVDHLNQSFSAVEYSAGSATNASFVGYDGYNGLGTGATDPSSWSTASGNYENYYQGYGYSESGDYGTYEHNYVEGSAPPVTSQVAPVSELKISGKRGRNDIPQEIMEVKQDDLMKNRPREDQTKLTGIAFGPSYQPASTRGKPTKLHKRKHQIGSLYHEMKQKEMELAERRSRGLLTKAETQANHAEEKDQEKNDGKKEEQKHIERKIEVYRKALDDLVAVNSVFTVAVFLGLSFATPDQQSLDDRVECNAASSLAKRLVVFEVVSFSWFLFSSLAAKTLKVDLKGFGAEAFEGIRLKIDRQAMLYGSVLASVLGCLFLLISMVNVIQIRLGKLSCLSGYTIGAAVSLIIIVSLALITYVWYAIIAIIRVHQSGFLFQRKAKAPEEAESQI